MVLEIFKIFLRLEDRLRDLKDVSMGQSLDPLDWNSPCRDEGASHQEVSTRVRRREELNWALQLKSSDQQILSTMSGTDSPLERLERPSLVKAPISV